MTTDIDPDRSSKKVGFSSDMFGLLPKLDPKLSEAPAVYSELLLTSLLLKDWILLVDIADKVSWPFEVNISDVVKLDKSGSLINEILF